VLEEREDPLARGVFASFGRAERPMRLRSEVAPSCGWSQLAAGGAWLVCGTDAGFARYDAGAERWRVPGRFLGGAVAGGLVMVWDAAGEVRAFDAQDGAPRGVWPRPWDGWLENGDARYPLGPEGPVWVPGAPPASQVGHFQDAVVGPGGRLAVLADDGTLWRGTPSELAAAPVATGITGEQVGTTLAWLPDGGLLVGTVRGRVVRLDAEGRVVSTGETGLGLIGRIVVAADGRHAALIGAGGRVGLWRVDPGLMVADLGSRAEDVAFTADGLAVHARSEERRVGKECRRLCRSRWSPYH
jgi:hypothetical protein